MSSNLEQRSEMIRQMLATFDREPSADRIKGYLTVTAKIPLGSLAPAIRSAMEKSGSFPPGPGEIVSEWKWQREHPPADLSRPQLTAGSDERTLAEMREMAKVLKRAREIREEGKRVPAGYEGRRASIELAAEELGVKW